MQGVNPPIYSIRRILRVKFMTFANLKKQSRLGSLTSKLTTEIEKMNSKGTSGADDRLWKLEVDKAGNGYAVIRFLPAPDGEELPWAKVWSHAFQGPGGWYIENSLTTLGGKDPVSEYNRLLWNSGNDADKDLARKQKRKLTYIANIYVVKDPTNPHNEGKTFLYNLKTKDNQLVKEQEIPSGHNPDDYIVERLECPSHDERLVPITITRHKKTKIIHLLIIIILFMSFLKYNSHLLILYLNLTIFLAEILASIFVFGLRPILSFLLITSKVPKDDILTLLDFNNSKTRELKKSSIIDDDIFLEKPKF